MNSSTFDLPPVEYKFQYDLERKFKRLCWTIASSEGEFALILVCCNDPRLRLEIVKRLQNESIVPVQTRFLPKMPQTLYAHLANSLGFYQPSALTVLGLESTLNLESLLMETHKIRDKFRQSFRCPLVLWVTDEVWQKLLRLVPDFESWAMPPIDFT